MRGTVEAVVKRLRDETSRVGETAESTIAGLARDLGFVTRTEFDEVELRLAQLEHRLRLLEHPAPPETPK
jgi:polyhydroxyalkanoate synthesis regulator phasin